MPLRLLDFAGFDAQAARVRLGGTRTQFQLHAAQPVTAPGASEWRVTSVRRPGSGGVSTS